MEMGYAAAQHDPMQMVRAWLLLMIGQIWDGYLSVSSHKRRHLHDPNREDFVPSPALLGHHHPDLEVRSFGSWDLPRSCKVCMIAISDPFRAGKGGCALDLKEGQVLTTPGDEIEWSL
jgi:hypothetical protein